METIFPYLQNIFSGVNKRRSFAAFSVEVAHKKLIEHKTSLSKKPSTDKNHPDGYFVRSSQADSFRELRVQKRQIRLLYGPFRMFSLSTFQS